MFRNTPFNGDVSNWNVSGVKRMVDMFKNTPLEGREPVWYIPTEW